MSNYVTRELSKIEKRLLELFELTKDEFTKQRVTLVKKVIRLEKDRNKRLDRVREGLKALEKELLKPSYQIIETFQGVINIWEMKGEEFVRTIDPKSKEGKQVLSNLGKRS